MKPTPEQLATAKAYFAAKYANDTKRRAYLRQAVRIMNAAMDGGLRPAYDTESRPTEHFAPALASVLSAGLLGEVQP